MIEDEWAPLAAQLSVSYPTTSFGEYNAEAYFLGLKSLDAGYVALALAQIVQQQDRFPSIAEVRRTTYAIIDRHRPLRIESGGRGGGNMSCREWIDQGCPPGDVKPEEALAIYARLGYVPGEAKW